MFMKVSSYLTEDLKFLEHNKIVVKIKGGMTATNIHGGKVWKFWKKPKCANTPKKDNQKSTPNKI